MFEMSDAVIVAWIGVVGIAVPVIYRLLDKWLDRRDKSRILARNGSMAEKTHRALSMNRICSRLLEDAEADRVTINIFHNGGEFITGMKMDKFTCVAEDYKEGLTPIMQAYQGTLLTIAPYAMHRVLVNKEYIANDISCIVDKVFRDMVMQEGMKSIVMYLITDVFDKPMGFVAMYYTDPFKDRGFTKEDITAIVSGEVQSILKHILLLDRNGKSQS